MAKASKPKPELSPDRIIKGKFGRTYPAGSIPPKEKATSKPTNDKKPKG